MRIHASIFSVLLATAGASCVSVPVLAVAADERPPVSRGYEWVSVAGTGVHYFSSAIVHSAELTDTGVVQRSTETVELSGDLEGRVLYQPVSVFDFAAGTLVNTGHQVFSGTVLGSAPVLLYDDEFRFDVDLNTGATTGKVFLSDRIAGPRVRCNLDIFGTGLSSGGDSTLAYSGRCKMKRGTAAGEQACAGARAEGHPGQGCNNPVPGS